MSCKEPHRSIPVFTQTAFPEQPELDRWAVNRLPLQVSLTKWGSVMLLTWVSLNWPNGGEQDWLISTPQKSR